MSSDEPQRVCKQPGLLSEFKTSEDWWAVWCGGLLLVIAFAAVLWKAPADLEQQVATAAENDKEYNFTSPLQPFLAKPGKWTQSPVESIYKVEQPKKAEGDMDLPAPKITNNLPGIAGVFLVIGVLFAVAQWVRGFCPAAFLKAFPFVFLLATLSYVLAAHSVIKAWNLEYALWALMSGLIISNTVGTPKFLKPAALTEFYIKTGLVLMGADVLMSRLLALGVPGIFVAWVVTPVVLVSTYIFGQKVLKIPSKSLTMVIAADMSVCGVSAAIATAGACKAKKEELSLAIGLSLSFTVIMMVAMPAVILATGMDVILGAAWMGGTIDATGAVAAAGAFLGETGKEVAVTVKMIQNILIGVTAFGVAVYWATYVDRDASDTRPRLTTIWHGFPKFVLGFAAASIIFSIIHGSMDNGQVLVDAMINGSTKTLRGWFFCLAFVSIGLQTNFKELLPYLKGGRPLVLYLCGQTFNLCLTLFMAWLMYYVVFKDQLVELRGPEPAAAVESAEPVQ
jgi:uncharacterized membrane protein YadS